MKTMYEAIDEAKAGCDGDYIQMAGWLGSEVAELSKELDRAKARINELLSKIVDMEMAS